MTFVVRAEVVNGETVIAGSNKRKVKINRRTVRGNLTYQATRPNTIIRLVSKKKMASLRGGMICQVRLGLGKTRAFSAHSISRPR